MQREKAMCHTKIKGKIETEIIEKEQVIEHLKNTLAIEKKLTDIIARVNKVKEKLLNRKQKLYIKSRQFKQVQGYIISDKLKT